MSRDEVRPDPVSLRGIAHPLRIRILNALRADGPATATLLAQRLAQSTGATSYHLRQLAQYGFVLEEPARGAGRERWWKAAHRSTLLEFDLDREAPTETETYLRAVASFYADRVDRWLSERTNLSDEWRGTSTISDWRLRLTPAEAQELHESIFALVGRYRRADEAGPDTPDGAETVVLQAQLMPFLATPEEPFPAAEPSPAEESSPAAEPSAAVEPSPAASEEGGA